MNNLKLMGEEEKRDYFQKYKQVCDGVALSKAFKNHIDIEEVKSEAYFILVTCIDRFDEGKGTSFDHYLYSALNVGLDRFCEENKEMQDVFTVNYRKKKRNED